METGGGEDGVFMEDHYMLLYATVHKCYSEQSLRAQDKVTCDKLSSERDVAG